MKNLNNYKVNILFFKPGFNYNNFNKEKITYIYEQISYVVDILSDNEKYNINIAHLTSNNNKVSKKNNFDFGNKKNINFVNLINYLDCLDNFLNKYDKVIILNSSINYYGGIFPNYNHEFLKTLLQRNGVRLIHLLLIIKILKNERLRNNCYFIFDDIKLSFKIYDKLIQSFIKKYEKDNSVLNKALDLMNFYKNKKDYEDYYFYYNILYQIFDDIKNNFIENKNYEKIKLKVISFIKKTDKIKNIANKNAIFYEYENVYYFPIEKIALYYWNGDKKINEESNILENKKYDIVYAANYRNGERTKLIIEYLFDNNEVKSVIFGNKIKRVINDYKELYKKEPETLPEISNKILPYKDYMEFNSKVLSTLNIAEKEKKDLECVPPRIYDSIINGNVTFIDYNTININKVFTKNKFLKDFLYIKNKKELSEKIKLLKNNNVFLKDILNMQYDELKNIFVKSDYKKWLFSLIDCDDFKLLQINENEIYTLKNNEYDIKKYIDNNEIKNIEYQRYTFIINDKNNFNEKHLYYPGFVFNNKNECDIYYNEFYKNILNINVSPRGSLKNGIIFLNYTSSDKITDNYKIVSQIFGEKNKLILDVLKDLKLYAYFTDIYKGESKYVGNNFYLDLLEIEINTIKNIVKNPIFICLGNYEIYDVISDLYKIKINKINYIDNETKYNLDILNLFKNNLIKNLECNI